MAPHQCWGRDASYAVSDNTSYYADGVCHYNMLLLMKVSIVLSALPVFVFVISLSTVKAFTSISTYTIKTQTYYATNNDIIDDTTVVYGSSPDEVMPQKFFDGLKFNLFGIGRLDDEDSNGAYQPPPQSMKHKLVLITGASSGLGLESAKRLALAGATVVITARTDRKVKQSINAVEDYCNGVENCYGKTGKYISPMYINNNPKVRGVTLDLDDLSSVRSFPKRYTDLQKDDDSIQKIDVLMLNAGGGGYPSRVLTVDGIEKTFQSNHLGPFVLTAKLYEEELLNKDTAEGSNGCTVINVSSCTHRCAIANYRESIVEYGFDFDNVNCDKMYADDFKIYAQGKLANILFTRELQKRADMNQQNWLTAVSLEPGGVASDIWRHSSFGYDPVVLQKRRDNGEILEQPKKLSLKERILSNIFYRFGTQVERGANVQVWLAYLVTSGSTIHKGRHYDEYRTQINVPEYASNEETTKRLWELSEEMAGIKFDFS